MKIGVISDTHNVFDPKIPQAFHGVEHIVHAGDVGQMTIIHQLEEIAPVTAVFGNTDTGLPLRETELVELAGLKLLVHHVVDVHAPSDTLRHKIHSAKPDIVVFGHTHKPLNHRVGDVLFFNPGYAGKPRFGMPRSLAILECDKHGIRAEYKLL